jgi:MFS family permease
MPRLVDLPAFRRVWAAATVSSFGTYVTTLALQVLATDTLRATALQLGLISAARWLPYLLIGLYVGVLVDRHRRLPVLVGTDFGRAVLLCLIPSLYAAGLLGIPVLIAIVAAFGTLSVFFDAADQSFLPRVVPASSLTTGYARLEQSDGVAQTTGPLLAGVLVRTVGAPMAILVDAVSYVVSGLFLVGVRVAEPPAPATSRSSVRSELREGVAWVYRHRTLASMAAAGHIWFLAHSVLSTVLVVYVLHDPARGGLGLGPVQLGVVYAAAGVGAVLGSSLASPAGSRLGVGRVMVATYWVMPAAWSILPLVRPGPVALAMAAGSQFVVWTAMGADGANELAYRNAVTPGRLQARMNTTIRSVNRGAIVIGAPLGGFIADAAGYRPALWVGVAGLVAAAVVLSASPFRSASMSDAVDPADPIPA